VQQPGDRLIGSGQPALEVQRGSQTELVVAAENLAEPGGGERPGLGLRQQTTDRQVLQQQVERAGIRVHLLGQLRGACREEVDQPQRGGNADGVRGGQVSKFQEADLHLRCVLRLW
jgi:hypothetical protein